MIKQVEKKRKVKKVKKGTKGVEARNEKLVVTAERKFIEDMSSEDH